MHPTDVFDLIKDHMAYGEADPAEFTSDLDELLHLRTLLGEIATATRTVRQACDEKIGEVLGRGVKYDYGDNVVSWSQSYKYKAIPEAVEAFVTTVASVAPDEVHELFNPNSIRKTAIERAANRMGVDPVVTVDTILEKVWDKTPKVQVKPKEL